MVIERNKKEVIIKFAANIDTEDLQDFLNYARYKELTAGFSVKQVVVDKLSDKINSTWWNKNKTRLAK